MNGRALLFGLLLASLAVAGEGDGAYAAPHRWTHPRGPASGGGRSRDRPPKTFGGIGWSLETRGTILAPPVTWDGIAFVVSGSARSATLYAVNTGDGKVQAKTSVKKIGMPRPAAWEGAVFLLEDGRRIVQYRVGKRFAKGWKFDAGKGASPPRIHEGEIYVTTPSGLLRLRSGSRRPAWKVAGDYMGEPAVYGEHVYALRLGGTALSLVAHDRKNGTVAHECTVAEGKARGGRVVIGGKVAGVLLPPEKNRLWAVLSRKVERGVPALAVWERAKLLTQPLAGENTLIAMNGDRNWVAYHPANKKIIPIADVGRRPDLVQGAASAVGFGPFVTFGNWGSQLNGNRILWHLDERKELRTFGKGVRFGLVPAGPKLLLAVARDGKSLHAIVPEEIGS